MKTVFLTTIFPASKSYLKDFFNSLKKQTLANFDVIVINDGVNNFEKEQYKPLHIIEFKVSYSPAKNRAFGINKAVELGYEHIIFGDSDDYFEKNRVEVCIKLLANNDIVINDLNIFNENKTRYNYLSKFIKQQLLLPFDFFINANIAGLSNTAIKASLLQKQNLNFDDGLIAVDWYFFIILLLHNPEGKIFFTNKTCTYYRQHEQNTIGIGNLINEDKINLGIKVKLLHYKNLMKFCEKIENPQFFLIFEKKYQDIKELKIKIQNPYFLKKYIATINNNFNNIFNGWWSEIITIKEFEQYENKNLRQ